MIKRKKGAKLYKIVYKGVVYTGYDKEMLKDLIISKMRGN